MRYFSRMFHFWWGNSTNQHKGLQQNSPSASAHEESPEIGIDSALQVSTVWACVTLLVENIASLPLVVYKVEKDGQRTVDRSLSLYKILHDSPNNRQSCLEFWECMMLNFVLRGNAYAHVKRNKKGEVISLWPLSSDQIEVDVIDDGSLLYIYSYDSKQILYTQNDILHIRGMGNGIVGMSPLQYMRSSIGTAIQAQNLTKRSLKKDGRRPGVLMTGGATLTDPQRKWVHKRFDDIVTGDANELYVLEADFKFEPLGMTNADMQLLETRRFSVQDLARWFGVPSVLINDTAETTSLGSSVQQIVDGFYKLKLRPMLERIEQAIQQRVLTPNQRAQGLIAEFNLDALLRSSLKDRMEIYSRAVQNGIYTRDEARGKENLQKMPGGDILTAQVNLMPVELLGTQDIADIKDVPPEIVQQ